MKQAAGLALLGRLSLGAVGALGVLGTGCASTDADWRERYLEKERDASTVAAQLTEERNAHSTAVVQLEEAKARISDLEKENEGLKSRPAETVASEPAVAPPTDSAVTDALARLKSGGIDAHQTVDGNIAVVLPSDITYAAGSKDLTAAGRKAVDALAKEVDGQFSGCVIRVEGHTDADPIKKSRFADNFELGAERALTVVRYLVSQHKVAPDRLIAASRGDTMPVADNKSEKGKAKNRRVEVIIVVPKDSTLAK